MVNPIHEAFDEPFLPASLNKEGNVPAINPTNKATATDDEAAKSITTNFARAKNPISHPIINGIKSL
jgi:hypothetical protein